MMSRVRLRSRAILLAASIPLLAAPALAQDLDAAAARKTLDDRFFFVKALGRGWEPLQADARRTVEASGLTAEQAPGLHGVRDDIYWAVGDLLDGRKSDPAAEERAHTLFSDLAAVAVPEALRPDAPPLTVLGETHVGRGPAANLRAFDIEIRRGDRSRVAKLYEDALTNYELAATRREDLPQPFRGIAAVAVLSAREKVALEQFVEALSVLDRSEPRVAEKLGPGEASLKEMRAEREMILSTTGEVEVWWLGDRNRLSGVRGEKADYSSAALEFVPGKGGQGPPTQSVAAPSIRVKNGDYTVVAKGSAEGRTQERKISVRSGGNRLELVTLWPEGMVLVPAAAGAPAFLIDRTEVSNEQYAPFAREKDYGVPSEPADFPARGIEFRVAREFAAWAGKRLPTLEMWTHAAFGSPLAKSPRFPWGPNEGEEGVHFVGGGEPRPVTECPKGASLACGALNMAGNVMEWLDDDRAVGGFFKTSEFDRTVYAADGSGLDPFQADLLRTPIPSAKWLERSADPLDERRYFKFKLSAEALPYTGLRCVVELGEPRRNP